MEIIRKNVLAIQYKKVWNKWAWNVVKCEFLIGERFELDGNVLSYAGGEYRFSSLAESYLINSAQKLKLEEFVKKINEKYGEAVRWRAKKGNLFYTINGVGKICQTKESYFLLDDNLYDLGNYFKTREKAEVALEKIKKVLLEEE